MEIDKRENNQLTEKWTIVVQCNSLEIEQKYYISTRWGVLLGMCNNGCANWVVDTVSFALCVLTQFTS